MANGIGHFIRQDVIPGGMSVTEAARRLHVGRPALSNLLNGRAALSPSMALRLEKTFGADRKRLLDLQAASERDRRRDEDRAVAVGTYVPDFLSIRARQIVEWAGRIDSRQRLPVLLRRLGPVNTYLSASKMSTKWMKPMNITSSFSNRENIRR